jgi:hypothetical protein
LLEERGLITNKTKMIQTKITLEKDNKIMGQTKYNDSSEDIEIETLHLTKYILNETWYTILQN